MKIGIIGGSGFIGTHLIDFLKNSRKSDSIDIINIDKNQSEKYPEITVIGNVLNKKTLTTQLKGRDLVVLLAAEHRDDVSPVSLYYDVNVQGMKNTLEAMQANGISRIIFTSSVAVYGLNKENPDESFPTDPFNHYGKSKYKAEMLLEDWHNLHSDWDIKIIRPTVIFGENNRGNVYNLIKQISSGKFMMIGEGNNPKSMSYVGNVVAFIEFLMERNNNRIEVYNYADKPDLTTNDLVEFVGKTLHKKIPTIKIPYYIGMIGGYCFDILAWITRKKMNISSVRVKKFCATTKYSSAKVVYLGFVPPYTLEEGLENMLNQESIKTSKK